ARRRRGWLPPSLTSPSRVHPLLASFVFLIGPSLADIYTLSLHDALPISHAAALKAGGRTLAVLAGGLSKIYPPEHTELASAIERSEEHTSELQSRVDLVCRLLLEKKKANKMDYRFNLAASNKNY